MLRKIVLLILFVIPLIVVAQQPSDDCAQAPRLTNAQLINYCSNDGQYTNVGATPSFINSGPDVWFVFRAQYNDINISVSGVGHGGTVRSPVIELYTDCGGNGLVGSSATRDNVTTFYKGGLIIGNDYYIQISSASTGTFKLCVNNYTPTIKAGQDVVTGSPLCSKGSFTVLSVTGAGVNNNEAAGTCLAQPGTASESNSVWYKWIAANNGTLTFTITPTVTTDDIDWVLYDLGPSGSPATPNGGNAIRCAAGHGVDNSQCPNEPIYYKTGMNLTSTDLNEASGCGQGQNGFVKYIDMIQGHSYALLINNFTSGNNGFTMSFGGTGEFLGPQSKFTYTENQPCTAGQNYTFTNQATGYTRLVWRFGAGASLDSSTVANPPVITYSTPGLKTVVLEAYNDKGCFVVSSQTFAVGQKPSTPTIQSNKPRFCIGDTIILSTPSAPNTTYSWTGPNNFKSDQATVRIPVDNTNVGGTYTLIAIQGNCSSDPSTITIPAVLSSPVAAFTYTENQPCTPAQSYTFASQSTGYSRLVWRFGSGASLDSSNVANPPAITYSSTGTKTVVLETYNSNGCVSIASKTFIIGIRPAKPVIQSNKLQFCLGDTLRLSTQPAANTIYSWTGPGNFKSDQANISIPLTNSNQAGTYTLTAIQGNCSSDPATITIPPIFNNPVAAFSTAPAMPAKLSLPVTVKFFNQSANADTYLWDFGDGSTSTEVSPEHTYTVMGEYEVTLTAFKSNVCNGSVTKGTFTINVDNAFFIPNTFTPNGDNINDEFVVNISNIDHYHISIFNRWGELLFVATSIFDNWKGLYEGKPLPVGTYYYVIDAVSLSGEPVKKSGSITILR